jgi:diguanylate cyclase (GGDEF)-like protein
MVMRATTPGEEHNPVTPTRAAEAVRQLAFYGAVAHTLFIPLFLYLGFPLLALVNIFSVAAWLQGARLNRKGHTDEAIRWISAEILLHAVIATSVLGWGSGFQAYLVLCLVLTAFHSGVGRRLLWMVVAGYLSAYLGLYVGSEYLTEPGERVDRFVSLVLYSANYSVAFLGIGFGSLLYRQSSERTESGLALLARRDPLTKLPNRRCMEEILKAEVRRTNLGGKPFAVALADIDHFKEFNDHYGHDCGDDILRGVSQLLETSLRSGDSAARWGGEEFLILMRAPDLASARIGVERIRSEVAEREWLYQNQPLRLTLTFGLALYEPESCLESCLKCADARMYIGKRTGRDKVVSSDGSDECT